MNRSVFYIFLIIFVSIETGFSQKISLNKNNVFIIGRGTSDKQNYMRNLNIGNDYLTHIGIGLFENDNLMVYNISIDKINENGSALIKEDYDSFISEKGIFYIAIWEININLVSKADVLNEMNKISKEVILFDNEYKLDNKTNKLYCSEFVAKVLNNATNNLFKPSSTNESRSNFIRSMDREVFYYPVDFYIKNKSFEIIYEYCK